MAGAHRFIIDARASDRHFSRPASGPLLAGEGLCHVGFQGAPEDAQNWFVGSADIMDAFHQVRIPGWFFAFLAVLASEVGYTRRMVNQKRLAPDSLIYPVRLPVGFLGRLFCQDVTDGLKLTNLGSWVTVKTALTSISHV